jgi:hypothetical protein
MVTPALAGYVIAINTLCTLLIAPSFVAAQGSEIPPYIDGELAFHHHPLVRFVFYDPNSGSGPVPTIVGMRTPPTNLGIDVAGDGFEFREIHTHEGISGTLHVESVDPTKKYRLSDFFALWISEDPRIQELVDRAKSEGVVYLFDFNKSNQTYYTTRVTASDFLELPLDDNRHIVIYLPGETTSDPAMQPSG